ncbi:MAG: hypothetical protein J4F32_01775 [Dehalococcoidia bacterium]|nr:hypothetical protein [Dehalococcoidia bacterium]
MTTWMVDQRLQGNNLPVITKGIVDYIKSKSPLSIPVRAVRLLQFISKETSHIGASFSLMPETLAVYAWSESTTENEVAFLIDFLLKKGWLDARLGVGQVRYGEFRVPAYVRVTVEGHGQLERQEVALGSSQAFIAMWFDRTMDTVFENGISPAVEDAGYVPMRIDRKSDLNKIDDEIISEIRRSRFLVADFTYGDEGVRGGVYFAAGFAEGLGIPVIYTCRKDMLDKLHFDTRQYAHIDWETPEELRTKLKNRILARIRQISTPRAKP